jgi:signal transduction histidine kinase
MFDAGDDGLRGGARIEKASGHRAHSGHLPDRQGRNRRHVAGFEYGASDYVVKPFNPAELIARVKTHLKIKESTDLIDRQNQELRQWIHFLCHDLANPILGIQYLVEMATDPARFPEMTRHIREGAQSAMNNIYLGPPTARPG